MYLAIALLYHETTGRTQKSINDIEGAFFMFITSAIFSMSYGIIHFYPSQMPILRRETNEHIYDFSAYYVAEIFNILPVSFLRSFAGLPILYIWAGFDIGVTLYLQLGLTLLVATFAANAYGLFVSSLFTSIQMEIATVFDLMFLSFAGVYINLNSVSFARYISPFYFTNEGLSILFWSTITEIGISHFFVLN